MSKNAIINTEKQLFRKVEFGIVQNRKTTDNGANNLGKKVLVIYTGGLVTRVEANQDQKNLNEIINDMKCHQTLVDIRATYLIENNDKWIATPVNEQGQRVYYTVVELYNDTSKRHYKGYDLWVKIAETIKENYNDFSGFVVVHEEGNLDYCASAQSFMCQNLRKSVVMTIGMIPLKKPNSDAINNLAASINIAGNYVIPEVTVFIQDTLYRGSRILLYESNFQTPFDSPNYPVLATYDSLGLDVNWGHVKSLSEAGENEDFTINTKMSRDVIHLENFPQIQDDFVEGIIGSDAIKGVVMELYGVGNMQTNRPNLVNILKKELDKGKLIFYTTMCQKGIVSDLYENSASQYGLVSLYDMTTPAAYCKQAFLIGNYDDPKVIKTLMKTELAGEMHEGQNLHADEREGLISYIRNELDDLEDNEIEKLLTKSMVPYLALSSAKYCKLNYLDECIRYDKKCIEYVLPCDSNIYHALSAYSNKEIIEHVNDSLPEDKKKLLINQVNKQGYNPLHTAIVRDNKESVSLLRSTGAEFNISSPNFDSDKVTAALLEAAYNNDLEKIQLFYYAGLTNLEKYVNCDKRSIGHIAVAQGHADIIRFLKDEAVFNFAVEDFEGFSVWKEAECCDFDQIKSMLNI